MDSQQSDLFDSGFDYPEFRSQMAWPTPSDSISIDDASDRGGGVAAADHHSEGSSPSSLSAGAGNGAKVGRGGVGGSGGVSSSSQVDALAAGMGNLNFEETGDDDGFDYGKNDFTKHACKYCGISNP